MYQYFPTGNFTAPPFPPHCIIFHIKNCFLLLRRKTKQNTGLFIQCCEFSHKELVSLNVCFWHFCRILIRPKISIVYLIVMECLFIFVYRIVILIFLKDICCALPMISGQNCNIPILSYRKYIMHKSLHVAHVFLSRQYFHCFH